MTVLYHYTCDHGRTEIGEHGRLFPAHHLIGVTGRRPPPSVGWLPGDYVWLTDMPTPHREALGLTSDWITCDRCAHRYRVTDNAGCLPWITVRRTLPRNRVALLENAPDARPRHWWISADPVPVIYDPRR